MADCPTPASDLAEESCTACRPGAPHVTDGECAALLLALPGWAVVERGGVRRLERCYRFADFAAALAFANRVGAEAAAAGHHPELVVTWGAVTVDWWTHAIGGLHRNDFVLAARTDRCLGAEA